jgi:hypothetical protein
MRSIVLASMLLVASALTAFADCERKPYCKDVSSCAEAHYHLTQCGLTRLDRDRDGIPCEKMCGKTLATMRARIEAQPYLEETAAPTSTATATASLLRSPLLRECGTKRYCREMLSCDEARFYLTTCGVSGLDGNRDGIPCNGLCRR